MKIDLSREEYTTLLELLEIAGWVLHAHRSEERRETRKFRDFEQRIYSYAKGIGCANLIKYDEGLKHYFPTREFEESSSSMDFVEEFENDSFWDELIDRLADRDLLRREGEKKVRKLTLEERFRKLEPLQDKYAAEFEAHGLENLTIEAE